MSTLVVLIPPRARRRVGDGADAGDPSRAGGTEYAWVRTRDGIAIEAQGQAAAALLPRADATVAVLAETDVAWHRISLPKAPAARMRAALAGLLEDTLLDETDDVHFALAPQAAPGQLGWVAVVDRAWLRGEIAALEKGVLTVDRVVPIAWPDNPPSGHFAESPAGADGVVLHWAHADGVASLPLAGTLARTLLPQPPGPSARWSATPGAAAVAQQWLGTGVSVMPAGERALQAARSLWNLRQFDLAPTHRGARALRNALRRWRSAEWRPVRRGLLALVLVQLVGLNAWAWQQGRAIAARRAAIGDLVLQTFPRVNPVDIQRDAAAVMQREVRSLRAQAGKPSDNDLEPMLLAAAAAWPPDRGPATTIRYESGRLTIAAPGWSPAQIDPFRARLQPAGIQVDVAEGALTLRRKGAR